MKVNRTDVIALFVAAGKKEAQVAKLTKSVLTKRLTKLVSGDEPEGLDKKQSKLFGQLAEADEIEITVDEGAKAKKSGKAPAKEKKEKAAPKPKKGLPGIRNVEATNNRPYACGVALEKFGLEGGITDEMVKFVDEYEGVSANERETIFALRNAWQAVRGHAESGGKAFKFKLEAPASEKEEEDED